jgi:hypothetical protein
VIDANRIHGYLLLMTVGAGLFYPFTVELYILQVLILGGATFGVMAAIGERVFRGPCLIYIAGFLVSAAWSAWCFEICGVTVLAAGALVGFSWSRTDPS